MASVNPNIEITDVPVGTAVRQIAMLLPRIRREMRRGRGALPPEIDALLRGASLSGRHFLVLLHLADAGELTVSALSERLDLNLSTVSIVVHQLAEYGLVERHEDPADRRRTLVRIEAAQRDWVAAAVRRHTEPIRRTMLRLEPAERATFIKVLAILAEEAAAENHHDGGFDAPGSRGRHG